jgi:26S proteasome regulatory subunit N7
MADNEEKELFPTMALAQMRFALLSETPCDKPKISQEMLNIVKEKSMLPFYEKHLCPAPLGPVDEVLKATMQKANDEELAKLEEKLADAKENLGDVEVRDVLVAKADFWNRIGNKEAAIEAYEVAFDKTVGIGGKMDIILTNVRIALFFDDKELANKQIVRAKTELSKGGDWERRNKLKVYEGIFNMINRDWKAAAELFLNVMPTFTATELVEFKDFIFYTVVLTMVACDRPTLRTKLVNSPEVLSAIGETPHLKEFMDSFFYCRYADFMKSFVPIIDLIRADRYLSRHLRHYVRIMRLNAYRQFLASYRSVTLQAMADEFGVTPEFIDTELSSFISSGKLTCKIDKVGGVIESNEADQRSQVYVEIIKQGDALVNRMQKLSGAIDM